ncbi:MAG: tRNA epoxyqueuosine(34) reductase QueG [Myxococcota bacterium]
MSGADGRQESTRALERRAYELGFHAFGVADARPPIDPEGRLQAWLEEGMHGGMEWMADSASRRIDVQESLPGARSVIAVAVSYYRPEPPETPEPELRTARYAQGLDYHRWVRRRLRKLRLTLLELFPGAKVYPTVDTSPVLERAWAERAGVAWIGKSTMAIHPRLGTYTFLGTLITDAVLQTSTPLPDRCGSCTACLDACPTDAFPEPGVLDARKCISYWTLETRDQPLPDEAELHGWVAGCDVCQEVCPWNKFALPSTEPRTEPRAGLRHPDVEVFSQPSAHEALTELIAGTALQRTGAEALRRNATRARARPRRDSASFEGLDGEDGGSSSQT